MIIRVDRYLSTATATLSKIYVDGTFICFGLEDEYREVKVPEETRIPAGVYKVLLRKEGRLHNKYRERFGSAFHEGMLWLQDVPNFDYILIHMGNTEKDTAGCLIVGMDVDELKMEVKASLAAYKRLYALVVAEAKRGHLYIEYEDNDK